MSDQSNSTAFGEKRPASPMLNLYLEPIVKYLNDERFTGIAINRPGEVWCRTRGTWERFEEPKLTFEHCLQLATLIAGFNNDSIDPKKGFLAAALPGGERVNIAIPPSCQPRTVSMTIRKFNSHEKTLEELDAEGAFNQTRNVDFDLQPYEREMLALKDAGRIAEFLRLAVESKRTIIIAGATGSGKTYITKSLIRCIPATERLITIEDVWELFLQHHPNKVHLFFAREAAGSLKVGPKDALAACLRMEPERILLAELRGDEAWEFIKAAGSGHPGLSTVHANSATEAFEQLLALVKDSKTGAHLDVEFIKRRLYATIDVVLFYSDRQLREIYYDPNAKRKNLA